MYLTVIKPKIDVDVFDTLQTVYMSDRKDYNVEIGNEFSVLCVSFGEFNGRVTWIKKGNQGK